MPSRVYIVGNSSQQAGIVPARVDENAEALVTMDTVHDRVHRGQMFVGSAYNASLAAAGTFDVLFRVGTGHSAHLDIAASLGGDGTVQLYEAPVSTVDGTALTLVDRNRITKNTPTSLAFTGPTLTSPGTLLVTDFFPGGSGGSGATPGGSSDANFTEVVLGPGDYLIRVTNTSGAAAPVDVNLNFYEPY